MFTKKNKRQGALIDRIKYDGLSNEQMWIVYKYPNESFVLGSQLIVNQGQEALFFKGGVALDLFGPGTYTLQTGNLPLLNEFVSLPFGGDTPFTAEVYYVNKITKLNMNWGTATPFSIEDPKYEIILPIRAHGTYGLRIKDARMFVNELIGAIPNGSTITYENVARYFSGILASKIKNVVSKYMIKRRISFLEITAYFEQISNDCQEIVKDEFDRFGIEILYFSIEAIAPPKEAYEKLQGYKEELSMGKEFYKQRRIFDTIQCSREK